MEALALQQPSVPAHADRASAAERARSQAHRARTRRRKRYRYVSPSVRVVEGGYMIESPCCSRNVDPGGGRIDVALLQYVPGAAAWRLYRKQHDQGRWHLHATFNRLCGLLEEVNTDPLRLFWQ